jgi:hypothetical protein
MGSDLSLTVCQLRDENGARRVAVSSGERAYLVPGAETLHAIASQAIVTGVTLAQTIARHGPGEAVDLARALEEGRLLAPIDHPDPAHCHLSGVGLSHFGLPDEVAAMRAAADDDPSDMVRMYRMGLEGGKPPAGAVGVQPEWFYKGDGGNLVGPGVDLVSPAFALDGGEEPEIAGIYVIGPDGAPRRLGVCLANEFSDHVMKTANYHWVAHSKVRPAALGPELLAGPIPADIRGQVSVLRDGATLWTAPFATGEANMMYSIDNLERHLFKYAPFRRPGDVHVHFFGCAMLSHLDGVKAEPGDVFEIAAAPFKLPLRNRLAMAAPIDVAVRAL